MIWNGVAKLRRRGRRQVGEGDVERPPELYDQTYRTADHWNVHYTLSRYYPLWTVIGDRLQRRGVQRVLDLGCGPGQVASFLRDRGIPVYKGLDFSSTRIDRARAVCPEYDFVQENVYETDLLETFEYDCVLATEFLEHIARDLEVLQRVRRGTVVLASVPNFPGIGHVRHFRDADDVRRRYGPVFSQVEVSTILGNEHGKTYFLLEGIR